MPAKIIQPQPKPFISVPADSVTLDIIDTGLRNTLAEMDAELIRSAMSPSIREQHDQYSMIATAAGKLVAGHLGSMVPEFLEDFDGTIEEGDVFLTNDPYACHGAISHLNDWLVMYPVFKEGRLIAWTAMFGHMTDVGGKIPGSLPNDAREIYQEGIRIPFTKIYKAGELQEDYLDLVLHNCRSPRWNRSDLHALVASCQRAAGCCIELAERFGDDLFQSAMDALLERCRQTVSGLLEELLPEQPLYFEDYVCDDGMGGGPFKIACSMTRKIDGVIIDFEGTDPQSAGPINLLLHGPTIKVMMGRMLARMVNSPLRINGGFHELVELRVPDGCLLRPRGAAALSCRTHALGRVMDVLAGLFGQANPELATAAGFSSNPHFMYSGKTPDENAYHLFQLGFGGLPGKPSGDGVDGHSAWSGFQSTPSEEVESHYPIRVEVREALADSGGAGLYRGGNALRIAYRFLADGEISVLDDRWLVAPWGVNGGQAGARSKKTLVHADGSESILPSKSDHVPVKKNDLLYFDTWGGGGWGDPLQRDPQKVLADAQAGLVTVVGSRDYGVVIEIDGEDLVIDQAATLALRAEMNADRGKPVQSDRGPDIENLLARCQVETGLARPSPPGEEQA